jgi:protein-disulfide isomerase
VVSTYVQTGQVRYVFKNFPLQSIHPQAQAAAEAAECAGEQGKYWEMHDALFGSQEQWSGQQDPKVVFGELAADLELDQGQFDSCLDEGRYETRVLADQEEGQGVGVSSTPDFRLNGAPLTGAQPFTAFQERIDYYLAGGEPPSLEVSADSFRSMGQADAPVVITEFSDYQCPACTMVHQEVVPELITRYVDSGKVRFVYREFPIPSLHPNAPQASEAAVCAGLQDRFWEMHEKLFATSQEWGADGVEPLGFLRTYAKELGLDTKAFDECLDSGEAETIIQGDFMAAESLGVNATPYFFVNELPIRGGLPIDAFARIIDYVAAGGEMPEILPGGDDWHLRGNTETARAITIAFVDYTSPESGQHARDVLPQLVDTYIDEGKLLYILHPWTDADDSPGALAAGAAECTGKQGKFWEMHSLLFENQESWTEDSEPASLFVGYAEDLGLDTAEFEACLDSDWVKTRVQAGSVVGLLYGVPGAPVFLFNNGEGTEGSPTFEEFQTTIDSILNQ